MAGKNVIAVVGATGSQGGGLARAILADRSAISRCGPSRATRTRRRPKPLADAGAEVVHADLDDVGSVKKAFAGAYGCVLRDQFLGALLGREGKGPGQEHRRRGEGRRRQARHLVDARRHAQADGARRHADADAAGEIPRAALRREGGSRRVLRRPARHYLVTSFYWDNLYMFGLGPEEGRRRRVRLGVPDGRQASSPASRPRTSARSRTAFSRRDRSTSARPSALRART